ncbi:polysaccharide lyase 6 family protein [Gilvimarinus agarilyticus]|uniref:polysaccharide lyase 6 family protein n=1 Tax=Gilvimarinus sp. 2_MG-2023 TaxID=3062666 RepID=UPI001C08165A|nr:polysaccharide lyase 6 family protein [Gilvimarinus sp. 2_MG-2023]MBU2884283.1 polysaccharide lyase 6 family protein [Gilvimarinus agarilyticus]MDO6569421.1 polysaccharide lyase 6 family protein [Gilvimarinus sp. 2_MG-2023]
MRFNNITKVLRTLVCLVFSVLLLTVHASAEDYLVMDKEQYTSAVKNLKPGDTIVLANGVWHDFEIVFEGVGTKDKPITLTAQTKGQVVISGKSNLRLAGEHLLVSGLVFKDGYSPTTSVISFRKNIDEIANNSRVTEIVIDRFNKAYRGEADYWVALYGKFNRFDHSHLEGKGTKGVTLAVRLDTEASRENHHRVDHNYFGPRPVLGANGGESLRIGTSHYSRSRSETTVDHNYFYRTDGEHEIISNKSGGNRYQNNVFFESKGTLTLRHGHDNLVENNVFIGNDIMHTGGIRVINERQVVRGNYLENLKGERFRGALVVMNGVPNSPLNRYDQVKDAVITNNTVINASQIVLGGGSDDELTAIAEDTIFTNNLIYNKSGEDIFTIYDDISGIEFSDNILHKVSNPDIKKGFKAEQVVLKKSDNGLLYPLSNELKNVGVSADLKPIDKKSTGVAWYPKQERGVEFGAGSIVKVSAEPGALEQAVENASAGDVLVLESGTYFLTKLVVIDKPLTLQGAGEVTIAYERSSLFEVAEGGSLHLKGLTITGAKAQDYRGNSVIRTSRQSMLSNYRLLIESCEVTDLNVNLKFNFIHASPGTLADSIEIINSTFSDISGSVMSLESDKDPHGNYVADYITVQGSEFTNIGGTILQIFSEAGESVFGPHFLMEDSVLDRVGMGKDNLSGASLSLHGVLATDIRNNKLIDSARIKVNHIKGEPKTNIIDNIFQATERPVVNELFYVNKTPSAHLEGNKFVN